MKQFLPKIFVGVLIVFSSSCIASKPLTSDLPASDINDVQVFHPVSEMYLINKGNKGEYSDSISRLSKIFLLDVLRSHRDQYPLGNELPPSDQMEKDILHQETIGLFHEINESKQLQHSKVPDFVSQMLTKSDKRFGILTVTTGFTRRKGNMTAQMLKGIGIGILTLGMYVPVPVKASSFLGVMIFDNQTQKVVFFRKSTLTEMDPLDPKVLSKQIKAIFKDYWETEPRPATALND